MMQQPFPPPPCCAYGSSFFATGPHTDGTRGSFVVLQYRIRLALASLTLIRGLAKSSLSRWLCSVRRRSFSSDMDCLCGRPFIFQLRNAARSSWSGIESRWGEGKYGAALKHWNAFCLVSTTVMCCGWTQKENARLI